MADDPRPTPEAMWHEIMRFDPPPLTDPYTEATNDTVFVSSGDLTADELHEWVLHISFYAGWPCGAGAYAALREVLAHPTNQQ
jgi:hypothetical protein